MQQRGSANSTYYVYDEYGRLCYVVPAPLIDRLGFGITHDDDTSIQQYAYVYRYDSHNNLIYKQLPGCDPIWMIYDAADKIILSQDGNQRKKGGYWSYFAYDQLGRIVYTSEIYLPNLNQPDLIAKFKDVIAIETTTTDNFGYTNSYFSSATAKLLMVNYYDNYDFLQLLPKNMAQTLMYQEYMGYGIQYSDTRNLLTGQRIYNLEENSYRITAMYYDIYGNVIQNRSSANLSEFYHQYIAYNFDGTKKQTLDEWDDMTEHYEYIYDHAGRLIKTLYRLNDAPTIVLNVNGYDQVGNQIAKARHNGSDKEHFNYDMRGQLTYIASGDFIEHLYYADSIPEGSNSVYNGNIAATTVIQGGQTLNFCYRYDQQNWLTHSMIYANDTTIDSEHFEYDPLGNITCLTRYNKGIKIDELSMQYNGNQLSKIQDNVENSDLYDVKEYVATSNDFGILYDANGNLTTDEDRKITEIKYNILNLPDTIIFTNGNTITYQYDAIGTKLKTSYLTLLEPILTTIVETPTLQTHYSFVHRTEIWYDRNRQKQCVLGSDSVWRWEKEIVYNEEGYTEFTLNDTTIISTDVYYFRKDHLGSNVAVWNATTNETPQRTFYYASGLPMSISIGDDLQNHKYNGKEFETINGLNEYDSHARRYYPAICRTTTIDPLCEKFYNFSPYSWCGNNFVNNVDPIGTEWTNINGDTITDHSNIKAYIFYNKEEFGTQTTKMYSDLENKYGEGSVALSDVLTAEEFQQDWVAMSSLDIREVNINHHGSNQAIHLDWRNNEYITSTGTGQTRGGDRATNVRDLGVPSGDITHAFLYLNTCHSNSTGNCLGNIRIFNHRIPGTSATLVGTKETLMQSFWNNFNFHAIRGTSAGVSYNHKTLLPEPQFFWQKWDYMIRNQ